LKIRPIQTAIHNIERVLIPERMLPGDYFCDRIAAGRPGKARGLDHTNPVAVQVLPDTTDRIESPKSSVYRSHGDRAERSSNRLRNWGVLSISVTRVKCRGPALSAERIKEVNALRSKSAQSIGGRAQVPAVARWILRIDIQGVVSRVDTKKPDRAVRSHQHRCRAIRWVKSGAISCSPINAQIWWIGGPD
jgi:hypothetical protein